MFEFENVRIIAAKELRDSLRNRWFLIFTVAFAGLALALSAIGQSSGTQLRFSGYGRTAASLINLVLLFIPLIGLTFGATNLAGDPENGTWAYLLAQPVNHAEVILGKYLGMAASLFATITLGFGLAGVALALQGNSGDVGGYVATIVLAYLLALAMLSLGFFMAAFVKKTASALGGSLFMWLLLVFIGDLGIMGTAVVTQMPIEAVFFIAMLNPLQLFKVSSILTIQASLEVLGPVGVYATEQFGAALLPLATIGLLLWIIIPLIGALLLFTRQEKFVWS